MEELTDRFAKIEIFLLFKTFEDYVARGVSLSMIEKMDIANKLDINLPDLACDECQTELNEQKTKLN